MRGSRGRREDASSTREGKGRSSRRSNRRSRLVRARCARADLPRRDALQLENAPSNAAVSTSSVSRFSGRFRDAFADRKTVCFPEKRRRRCTRFDGPTKKKKAPGRKISGVVARMIIKRHRADEERILAHADRNTEHFPGVTESSHVRYVRGTRRGPTPFRLPHRPSPASILEKTRPHARRSHVAKSAITRDSTTRPSLRRLPPFFS